MLLLVQLARQQQKGDGISAVIKPLGGSADCKPPNTLP